MIPSGQVKTIQNLEGGIVEEVFVQEGDFVALDEIIARYDETSFRAALRAEQTEYFGILATINRLEAEASEEGDDIVFDSQLAGAEHAALRARELEVFAESRKQLASRIAQLEASRARFISEQKESEDALPFIEKRLSTTKELLALSREQREQGITSHTEVLNLESLEASIEGERTATRNRVITAQRKIEESTALINSARAEYKKDVRTQLNAGIIQRDALNQRLTAIEDQLERRFVSSPVAGIVKQVFVTTRGAVLRPGDPIMTILPTEEDLLITARVSPQDIAFLHTEQVADVRLTAYDVSVFGSMQGVVERISADTIRDNDSGESFYLVTVRVTGRTLEIQGDEELPIIPGMTAEVDIRTGERSVLAYILKPIVKLRSRALQER